MRISGIRVLNNFKMKLINTRLANVNFGNASVFEQGTRYPVLPNTEESSLTFQQKFDAVFEYLIARYEPGWSGGNTAAGKTAMLNLLGVSAPVNPLELNDSVEAQFDSVISAEYGWFDIFTHPKLFAQQVKSAYYQYERARKPLKASHRFVDYQTFGIGEHSYVRDGGNMYFNMNKDSPWYQNNVPLKSMGLTLNYENRIERILMHSPYGHFRTPMSSYSADSKQSLPWISNRYATDTGFRFDSYLMLRESTTLRDLLNDSSVLRGSSAAMGVTVDGVTDYYIDAMYRGLSYPAGYISVGSDRSSGGYSGDMVAVGSPWIRYPNGLTWSGSLAGRNTAGLCFNQQTLVLFDGTTFPTNPQTISDRPVSFATGISYGRGLSMLADLNALSSAWGNSMEFIAYLGLLPYGSPRFEYQVPFALYKDPTVSENVRYMKWRLDASVKHWKEKFKSPIDGLAHVFIDAGIGIERTYHQYSGATYASWTNVTPSGLSFVENIPVSWARDQYAYTYGASGPSADRGVVVGIENFGWGDFTHFWSENRQKKSASDVNARHWSLDSDIASPLYMSVYDMVNGQRYSDSGYGGTANFNQIWGAGVCGSSTLGEVFVTCRVSDRRTPDGYPFFYNTFIEHSGGSLAWKRIPGTIYVDGSPVPWYHDRRFRLFYLYPIVLAMGGTILDIMHSGNGYRYASLSGWYDRSKGSQYYNDMGSATPATPPRNFWTGIARTSEFELLYACMKAGITGGLDSLGFSDLYADIAAGTA